LSLSFAERLSEIALVQVNDTCVANVVELGLTTPVGPASAAQATAQTEIASTQGALDSSKAQTHKCRLACGLP
jgi:hypothetical protein